MSPQSIFARPTALLAQILAAKDDMYKGGYALMTNAYQLAQKSALFTGRTRTYQPLNENDDTMPPQQEVIQASVFDVMQDLVRGWRDVTEWGLLRDIANADPSARASIEINGVVLLADVPTPALLSMEKGLKEYIASLQKLPTLEPTQRWKWNTTQGVYETEPTQTQRTRKVPLVISKAKATDKHPEQTEVYMEDRAVGTFTDTLQAKKLPATQQRELVQQAQRLLAAIQDAKQRANSARVPVERRADALAAYLLAPLAGREDFPVALD